MIEVSWTQNVPVRRIFIICMSWLTANMVIIHVAMISIVSRSATNLVSWISRVSDRCHRVIIFIMAYFSLGLEALPTVESSPILALLDIEVLHIHNFHSWVEIGRDLIGKKH